MNKEDISVQLYTTRKFQPYASILNFIKEQGLVNLELFGLESMQIEEFKNIIPCGIEDGGVTSIYRLKKNISPQKLDNSLKKYFKQIFSENSLSCIK